MTEERGASIEGTLHTVDGVGTVRLTAQFSTDSDDLWTALTSPQRLARWYGKVQGELHEGGEFTAFVFASEWDGRGRVDKCIQGQHLQVTQWENESAQHVIQADLTSEGDHTMLSFATSGMPNDLLWAYGAGWQAHLEDLASYLAGQDLVDLPASTRYRMDELDPIYRAMEVLEQ